MTSRLLSGGIRLLHALVLGLVGAGIVHIAILLLLPVVSERDAWSRLARSGDLYAVVRASGGAGDRRVLRLTDPFIEAVACRFDLGDGIARIRAAGHVPFWSVSVYDRNGTNVYSFNDHATVDGNLDILVLTPMQMVELRKDLPPEFQSSIFVEADIEEGIVVVNSFVPDPSWKPAISAYLKGATCGTE
ncbi:DUF1254 domain-containing protein [Mesorhizobium sp. L-8-10]|uniref:DUF1254 domain-containing protein n=1 Tax=unclassified Mesorhizobium TaxID=325217 RepID=UPI001927A586|nr:MULTISPECIES: DUF1254 domain-containing protein [unclassified Mesorhizobium]BCH26025.1 DUF1254 domain-containing protein [Mesorhizobium sp. L-8-3]BCH34015.1 DUF1254 domain-containing protein [Mesorhizobium sp. L-8-10]